MLEDPVQIAAAIRGGHRRLAARVMRWLDDDDPLGSAVLDHLGRPDTPSVVVGVTGVPGAGKSTLCDQMIAAWRARGHSVGVLAIDPSSPYSGGAILGDRVRMQRHATDEDVFIRSLATRGQLGGLSRSTGAMLRILEAMGFSRMLVETVGVGQDEVDVAARADSTVVVLVPGLGDEVQAIKAGLLEIADLFCVNKADRPGAKDLVRQLRGALQLRGPDAPDVPILLTNARADEGVEALIEAIEAREGAPEAEARRQARREAGVIEAYRAELQHEVTLHLDRLLAAEREALVDSVTDPEAPALRRAELRLALARALQR